MYMNNRDISTYSGTTVMLTVEGRLALAVDALAAAQKTRKEDRGKRRCDRAMVYLRPVISGNARRCYLTTPACGRAGAFQAASNWGSVTMAVPMVPMAMAAASLANSMAARYEAR